MRSKTIALGTEGFVPAYQGMSLTSQLTWVTTGIRTIRTGDSYADDLRTMPIGHGRLWGSEDFEKLYIPDAETLSCIRRSWTSICKAKNLS